MIGTGGSQPRSLSDIKAGEIVRLFSVLGGEQFKERMVAMGLSPGISFEVVRNRAGGPVVLSIRGARLILGRGMSHKIMVT
ncbi:MAG: FeoA family protein [Candidatus Glassbacteria bacterium]